MKYDLETATASVQYNALFSAGREVGVVESSAVMSECGTFRYSLLRRWRESGPICVFIGLNPSTADATKDDPTIRKCIKFAKAQGCGALRMLNLYAYRATDPRDLKKAGYPVGPQNDTFLRELTEGAYCVIAGWGKNAQWLRAEQVKQIVPIMWCLAKNKDGSPKHPLYVRDDTKPILYATLSAPSETSIEQNPPNSAEGEEDGK